MFNKERYFCTIQSSTNRKDIKTSKYLSNVKVMHVFKCIFILKCVIDIIYLIVLALYCLYVLFKA